MVRGEVRVDGEGLVMSLTCKRQGLSPLVEIILRAGTGPSSNHQAPPSVHAAIPPVLDGVVTAAVESSRDLSPPLPNLGDQTFDEEAFLGTNRFVIQRRLQILMISLSTLLRRSRANELCDAYPVERALSVNELGKIGVLAL